MPLQECCGTLTAVRLWTFTRMPLIVTSWSLRIRSVCPVSAIFALDDLPEKWKQYTELNESYVKAGKYTPEEFAKH